MSSCKNEDATVVLTGATATYNMNTSTFAKLLTKEGYHVDSTNNILIANTSDNGFVAVTIICTHEQKRKV